MKRKETYGKNRELKKKQRLKKKKICKKEKKEKKEKNVSFKEKIGKQYMKNCFKKSFAKNW